MLEDGDDYYYDDYVIGNECGEDGSYFFGADPSHLAKTAGSVMECGTFSSKSGGKSVDVCQTLSASEVLDELKKDVSKVNEILSLSPEEALLVLRRYNWNLDDSTLERYLNDPVSVKKELRIDKVGDINDSSALIRNDKAVECPVCGDEFPVGQAIALRQCRHFFCSRCFKANIQFALKNNHDLVDKRCPIRGCQSLLGLNVFSELLSPSEKRRAIRYFLNEYLSNHTRMRCCPNESSCDGVIRITKPRESGPDVTCQNCELTFCFRCQSPPHAPATCEMMRRWAVMLQENEPSLALILKTTKDCPSCHVRVEKNEGCNHMVCAKCSHEYCWVCRGPWDVHDKDYYSCKMPKTKTKVDSAGKQEFFLFCFERWDNHKRSLALEKKSLEKVLELLRQLGHHRVGSVEFEKTLSVILETQKILQNCRNVLANAYITLFIGDLAETSFHYRLSQLELRTEETSILIDVAPKHLKVGEIERLGVQAAHWCSVLQKEGFD